MTSRCKYCRGQIEWIVCHGKKVPLDISAWTYDFVDGQWILSSAKVHHGKICKGASKPKKEIVEQPTETEGETDGATKHWWKRD